MAKAIHYEVAPPPKEDAAREELDQLLHKLHETGILRLLNDFLSASPEVTKMLLNGLNREESRNALQNVLLLVMGIGRISPERFSLLTGALGQGVEDLQQSAGQRESNKAPGVTGVYKLLHDDALWQSLYPLLTALKSMTKDLDQPLEKPAAKRHGSPQESS